MSFINYSSREINCKIVYYGPGLCGKTTNLQYIYNKTNPELKGKMISLATETERTLFFDFLPLALGEIRGFKTRFHLYTVPGQVFYDASRKLILKGVDGVVFVADCQIERMEANVESVENLRLNLAEQGYDIDQAPVRDPVQQARPAQRRAARRDEEPAQPERPARLRGVRHRRQGRVRDAQGRRALRTARSQADEQLGRATPDLRRTAATLSITVTEPVFEGGCSCGAIRYRAVGRPTSSMVCHCDSCTRASGATAVAWVTFQTHAFRFERGDTAAFHSSPPVTRRFCGSCGTPLTYEHVKRPSEIDVTTRTLDDPEAFPPSYHAWVGDAPRWSRPTDSLPAFERSREA